MKHTRCDSSAILSGGLNCDALRKFFLALAPSPGPSACQKLYPSASLAATSAAHSSCVSAPRTTNESAASPPMCSRLAAAGCPRGAAARSAASTAAAATADEPAAPPSALGTGLTADHAGTAVACAASTMRARAHTHAPPPAPPPPPRCRLHPRDAQAGCGARRLLCLSRHRAARAAASAARGGRTSDDARLQKWPGVLAAPLSLWDRGSDGPLPWHVDTAWLFIIATRREP